MNFKLPSKNVIFWVAVIGFLVALGAIWASNNVDAIEDIVK